MGTDVATIQARSVSDGMRWLTVRIQALSVSDGMRWLTVRIQALSVSDGIMAGAEPALIST